MRIATQPTRVTIRKDEKQLENGEYFGCLGSVVTNYSSCAREIKSKIAMAKGSIQQEDFS